MDGEISCSVRGKCCLEEGDGTDLVDFSVDGFRFVRRTLCGRKDSRLNMESPLCKFLRGEMISVDDGLFVLSFSREIVLEKKLASEAALANLKKRDPVKYNSSEVESFVKEFLGWHLAGETPCSIEELGAVRLLIAEKSWKIKDFYYVPADRLSDYRIELSFRCCIQMVDPVKPMLFQRLVDGCVRPSLDFSPVGIFLGREDFELFLCLVENWDNAYVNKKASFYCQKPKSLDDMREVLAKELHALDLSMENFILLAEVLTQDREIRNGLRCLKLKRELAPSMQIPLFHESMAMSFFMDYFRMDVNAFEKILPAFLTLMDDFASQATKTFKRFHGGYGNGKETSVCVSGGGLGLSIDLSAYGAYISDFSSFEDDVAVVEAKVRKFCGALMKFYRLHLGPVIENEKSCKKDSRAVVGCLVRQVWNTIALDPISYVEDECVIISYMARILLNGEL